MITTCRCILLQIICHCLIPVFAFAEVAINNYNLQNQICNHTTIDSTLTNSTSYIGNLQENQFKIRENEGFYPFLYLIKK